MTPVGMKAVITRGEHGEVEKLAPVEQDHRGDGAELDGDLEALLEFGLLKPQEAACQDQMPGRRNRQELSEALDHPEDDSLQQRHGRVSSLD